MKANLVGTAEKMSDLLEHLSEIRAAFRQGLAHA
jgi:hypothetical protein